MLSCHRQGDEIDWNRPLSEETEDIPTLTQNDEQVWDRLKEGAYCIIWLKTEEKYILRALEVLEVVDGQQLIGWHY